MALGPFRISARTERWNVFTCLVFAAICAGIVALIAVCTPLDSLWWQGICAVFHAMAEPEIGRLRPTQQLGVFLVGLLFLAFLFLAALMVVLLPAVAAMVWITRRTSPSAHARPLMGNLGRRAVSEDANLSAGAAVPGRAGFYRRNRNTHPRGG